jgi:hypothetical protein
MRVDHFFLCVEEKNSAYPWWVLLESANLVLARVYGFLPRADEEPTSSMERRGRRRGSAMGQLLFVTSEPHSLGGEADNTEECRRGRGRRASSLQNLHLESRAIPATDTSLQRTLGRRKPENGIEGGSRGRVLIKKVWMRK